MDVSLTAVLYLKCTLQCKFGRTVSRLQYLCAQTINHSSPTDDRTRRGCKGNGRWKEWLSLPINYSDLPVSGQVAITIWDSGGPRKQVPFGGTTYSLFNPSDKFPLHSLQLTQTPPHRTSKTEIMARKGSGRLIRYLHPRNIYLDK
jgi:Phosphoinositide 3-kinase C2